MASDLREWNERIIVEFRANEGFVSWSTDEDLEEGRPIPPPLPAFNPEQGAPIILVSHIGARTGRTRTNPLMYQAVGDGFAIFATFGGSPRPPAWYRNIVKHPHVTLESPASTTAAVARVSGGSERERIWQQQVRLMPAFADFEAAADRQIPVVVLEPTNEAFVADRARGR